MKYSMNDRLAFFEWLNGIVKPEYKSSRCYYGFWNEAIEADQNGRGYEVASMYTVLNRPYSYRLS